MLKIIVYIDGSCLGNPGVGGYCAIMIAKDKEKVIRGMCKKKTTNNQMELEASISTVDWLNEYQREPCEVEFRTDSQYLIDCTSHNKRSWFTKHNRPNRDKWMELITKGLKGGHHLTFIKVAGHSGDPLNERADKIARECALKARQEVYGG